MPEAITSQAEYREYQDRYPDLFANSAEWTPLQRHEYDANAQFIRDQFPAVDDSNTLLTELVVEACARALSATDKRYGKDPGSLGSLQLEPPGNIWKPHNLPTLYHNGLGGRQAISGTTDYMNYMDRTATKQGRKAPYNNMASRRIAVCAATFDDLIYGYLGRKTADKVTNGDSWDELESARLASALLWHLSSTEKFKTLKGSLAIHELIEGVDACIEASTFDEESGKQMVGHVSIALDEQKASVGGDLWQLGTRNSTINTTLLTFENLWKKDTARKFRQVLRSAVLHKSIVHEKTGLHRSKLWFPGTAQEFITFADEHKTIHHVIGEFLIDNEPFLLNHQYPDDEINELMRAGKVENATLQKCIGQAIMEGMRIGQALHCAVAYAQTESATFIPNVDTSPATITKVLLTRQEPESIRKPVDARTFFDHYRKDVLGEGKKVIPAPRRKDPAEISVPWSVNA